jgi:hypothetical protein
VSRTGTSGLNDMQLETWNGKRREGEKEEEEVEEEVKKESEPRSGAL